MSYAIYGESDSYVHLVSAETEDEVVALFLEDVRSVNKELKTITNVYAVYANQEDVGLARHIKMLIDEAADK